MNIDVIIKENIRVHNPSWPNILDYLYRILSIGDLGSGKTNPFLNLINHQSNIVKYIYISTLPLQQNIDF